MKPSDFVSTSGQKQAMSQSVLQTEMTDAVNTGIVGRADKSEKSLKSGLYSVGKKTATGGAASAALAAVTNGRNGKTGSASGGASPKGKAGKASAAAMVHAAVHSALEGSELEGADDLYNSGKGAYRAGRAIGRRISGKSGSLDIKGAVKGAGKAAARGAVSDTLQGSELEGMDNVYDGARVGYHVAKGVKKHLGGKDPLSSDKSLGKLSEKKSAKKVANTVEAKRKAQAAGYFKRNVYTSAHNVQMAKETASAAKSGFHLIASGSKGGFFAAISSPAVLLLIGFLLIFILLAAILGGGANDEMEKKSIGSLSGVPAEVATYLKGHGYSNEGIAAILGNMQQESSMNPGTSGDDGYGTDSFGLIQLTGSNKNNFLRWCANTGKIWNSVSAQMEWSFSGELGTGYFAGDWYDALAETYYELEDGYEPRFGSDYYRNGEEMKTSNDVELATYSFMACHERPGSRKSYNDDVSRLDKRLEYARNFLAQLNTGPIGGGQDYVSAEQWQKDIVDACNRVSWPGASLCATWTSNVYRAAGYQVWGNGNSVLGHQGYGASYYPSRATTDLSEIKVGMLVSAQFGSNTAAGNTYGHVGIYIGDGMVMDSVNSGIRTIPLSEWVSQNGRGWIVCGYPWDWR